MFLRHLSILNFKNYSGADLDFDEKLNCLVGMNGSGKTNLLDAIYYLAFSKSFFNPNDGQNIYNNEAFFSLTGFFATDEGEEKISCSIKSGDRKIVKRNGKAYSRYADHIGLIPLVMISPIDILLIIEGSDVRRKWIDGLISQYDKTYLEHLISYNKAVYQRNTLLKQVKTAASDLEIWNDSLVRHGSYLFDQRKVLMEEFAPLFDEYYRVISSRAEIASLEYVSHLLDDKSFQQQLEESVHRDLVLKFTTVGPHKDDIDFQVDSRSARKFASQGQQKSLLLALRLAQASLISGKKGIRPLMLLDDIYDKLDSQRMSRLLEVLNKGQFGQLFITDTNASHLEQLLAQNKMKGKFFEVKNGHVAATGEGMAAEKILN